MIRIQTDTYEKQIADILRELNISEIYGIRPPFPEATELVPVGFDIYGREQRLAPNAAAAWENMEVSATRDGIRLLLVSAFRSVAYQRQIIERKIATGQNMEQILQVSAAPEYSEHHTGRAIDVAAPNCKLLTEKFEHTSEFAWLARYAKEYGFFMTYPRNNKIGVIYEPWHWTFQDDAPA